MNDSGKAVFLSYASQDATAARRICEALRATGVEVWFDQSELRGGDAWDGKIRKQIKECALFIPIVSANTQARREGYFRLEWKLADDRTHLMAKGTPFLVPVCVDDTKDWDAVVPDAFMAVQWTRLAGGEGAAAFGERVKVLLRGEQRTEDRGRRTDDGRQTAEGGRRKSMGIWIVAMISAVAVLAVWRPWRAARPTTGEQPMTAAAPTSEAVKFAQRARGLYDKVGFTHDDLVLADDFAKRATDAEPTSAFCWGVRAHVQAAFVFRGFAVGDELVRRSRDAQSFANRALTLQADEGEAMLALGRVATYQRAYTQAEENFARALAAHPDDNRVRRALGMMLRLQPKRVPEALAVLQEAVRRAPGDAMAHYDLAMGYREAWDFGRGWEACDAALGIKVFASALVQKASLAIQWKGDLAAMRAQLDLLGAQDRAEDRAVYYALWCGAMERSPERAAAAAALTSRDYLEDSAFSGPKAWFVALANQAAGRDNLARAQWRTAEGILRERLQADPKNSNYRFQIAQTLAWLGETEAAAQEVAPIEAAWREQLLPGRAESLARYYAALGDPVRTMDYLRQSVNRRTQFTHHELRFDPWWDKVRNAPEFVALLANPPPQPAPIGATPYLGAPKAAVVSAGTREAEQLVGRVYAALNQVGYTRDTLVVVEGLARQATDLAPDSARTWAAGARVQASYLQRTWDSTPPRRQAAQTMAARALALDPDEADALIAQAIVNDVQGASPQAEVLLRRAMELRPADALIRRLLATCVWRQGRREEEMALAQETARLFPGDPLALYDLGVIYANADRRDANRALASFDAALAIEPGFAGALLNKALILSGSKGDFVAAGQALDRLAPADRSDDRAVSFRMWIALLQRKRPQVEAAAALTARSYFEDTYFYGPKAWMLALASRAEGREATAKLHWETAENEIRTRLQAQPGALREKLRRWVTLAWLGRAGEIGPEAATLDEVVRDANNPFLAVEAARYYAGLGDAAHAVPYLRQVLNGRDTLTDQTLPFDPWWDKLRGKPEFDALLAEAKARVEKAGGGRK